MVKEHVENPKPRRFGKHRPKSNGNGSHLTESVSGNRRYDELRMVAVQWLHSGDKDKQKLRARLKKVNQQICDPPLELREVLQIVKDAARGKLTEKRYVAEEHIEDVRHLIKRDLPHRDYIQRGIFIRAATSVFHGSEVTPANSTGSE